MQSSSLPKMVKRLILLIGIESTHLLIKHFGGIQLTIGKGERSDGMARYEAIAEVIGYEAMEKLSQEFGSRHLSVPRCIQAFFDARDARITKDRESLSQAFGKHNSVRMLAEKYDISERDVYRILSNGKASTEGGGFETLCGGTFKLDKRSINSALIELANIKGGFGGELLEVIGADAFLSLVKMFGGKTLAIPALKREEGLLAYEKIAEATGYEVASNLAKNYAGEVVAIPKVTRALRLGRDIEIVRAFDRMLSNSSATTAVEELARKYQLTTRQVWSILKKPLPIH